MTGDLMTARVIKPAEDVAKAQIHRMKEAESGRCKQCRYSATAFSPATSTALASPMMSGSTHRYIAM